MRFRLPRFDAEGLAVSSRELALAAWRRVNRTPLWLRIAVAFMGTLVLLALLLLEPWIKRQAVARAARAGVELTVGDVNIGLGTVELREVQARLPAVPALSLALDRVTVEASWTLRPTRVSVHGAELGIAASYATLREQLRRFRSEKSGSGAVDQIAYTADGVSLRWANAVDGVEQVELHGGRFEREHGALAIGAELLRARARGSTFDVGNFSAKLRATEAGRVLDEMSAGDVLADIDIDHVVTGSPAQPRAPAPKAAVPVSSSTAGPGDNAAEASADKLRVALAGIARVCEHALSERAKLDLSRVRLKLRRDGEVLNIGPGRMTVTREALRVRVDFMPAASAPSPLKLGLELPLQPGDTKMELDGGPISLASLGVHEGDWGLKNVQRGEVDGKGTIVLDGAGRVLRFDGQARLRDLSLYNKALASGPITGIELGFRGAGELTTDRSRLALEHTELQLGKIRLALAGELERGPGGARAKAAASVPLVACQDALESIPSGAAPLLTGMQMTGTFGFNGALEFDTRRLDGMHVDWTMANDCRITATSEQTSPRRFASTWTREVKGADGRPVFIESGPGSATWVPYSEISPNMATAVLICEDGGFFRHHGFDRESIRNSLRENIRSNRFVRGASTVSMQLAKNLYLSREKTLGRKLQEAVFTMLLEQELTKEQMMELYLNVIEFAPGIYGVGPAARYYFNTVPARLSLGQALYMASILPNPKQQHFAPDGQVSPGWMSYLRKLMYIGRKIRRVSDDELADALLEQVTFGVPYSPRAALDESTVPVQDEALFGPLRAAPVAPLSD